MEDKFYYDGLNIYSKKEIDINKFAEYLNVNASNILLVIKADDWINRTKENIVIENKGLLEEDDEYQGYIYYYVNLFEDGLKDRFNNIDDENIIIDME